MRKFKFIGDPRRYPGSPITPKYGEIYTHEQIEKNVYGNDVSVEFLLNRSSDWEEFTEQETPTKPLHKDTDLGHFAGLAMQAIIVAKETSLSREGKIRLSIGYAQELITQLDKEVGNG